MDCGIVACTIYAGSLILVDAKMHFDYFDASVVCTFIVTHQIWFREFMASVHTASDRRCYYSHQTKLHVVSQVCQRKRFIHFQSLGLFMLLQFQAGMTTTIKPANRSSVAFFNLCDL